MRAGADLHAVRGRGGLHRLIVTPSRPAGVRRAL
jgi:hypothetical protein